jgi:hypothetical protein
MGSFQLVMVPARDGGPGKLVTMASLLTEEAEDLELPTSTIYLQGDSGSSLLPVQQIVVKSSPKARARQGALSAQAFQLTGGASIVGAFPLNVEASAGDVEFVPLPFYLGHVIRAASPETQDAGTGAPSLAALKQSVSSIGATIQQFRDTTINAAISDYARSLYVDRALGFTRTSLQIPLDVSLWPGKRYRVINSRGEGLFHGFLHGVQHSLEKKSTGSGGAPSTTLDFSHIEFPGFSLPGL